METIKQEEQTEPRAPAGDEVNWGRFVLDIFETLILAVVLFLGINAVSARVRVDGFSMRPTLEDGEFVLVNKLSYRFAEVERGDIIVFHFPMNPREELIKRVIGLPGEHLKLLDNHYYINGVLLQEPYLATDLYTYNGSYLREGAEITIPNNQYFVSGDNRPRSSDSREWGPIDKSSIIGRSQLRYFPFDRFGLISEVGYPNLPNSK